MTNKISYKLPWEALAKDNHIKDELEREISSAHCLYGIEVEGIARRIDCDDFLFYLKDGTGRYAVVHLTWKKESNPLWPSTEIYDNLNDWIENRMELDFAELSD